MLRNSIFKVRVQRNESGSFVFGDSCGIDLVGVFSCCVSQTDSCYAAFCRVWLTLAPQASLKAGQIAIYTAESEEIPVEYAISC